ncbi:hypothetical protein SAMN05216420_10443 [Nitrosospira sp. Nl5]|uniref:hypothetical protein n=1 Tax=Nitrosospira sp. Nl5 TaxID=200120 RepID=UPI00088E6BE2|nr:hypothetical protein [Nitrosospira sp. Nl5]SCY26540.1 hypothetical protein SAMN05216420_10443 [Nitrosospira sp. Nl5]
MTKHSALLIVLGLAAYSGHSGYISAQEVNYADANMGFGPVGMTQDMAQNSPFLSPGAAPAHGHSPQYPGNSFPPARSSGYPGGPLVVLPVPLPANGMSGLNSGSGFPGSYMPQGTPLHRFNGYIVCDPPDLAAEATTGATPKRVVKITTTRSLSAPGHSQPCPVYTVNGEIQRQKDYTTGTTPPVPNALQ